MSRHRNIRAIDVDEEYEGYYSCYGHSAEDEFCISPQTEAEFLYNRSQAVPASTFFELSETVPEEDYEDYSENAEYKLNSFQSAKLQSCVEAMQDVVGDTIPEAVLRKAAYDNGFELEKALNAVLVGNAPKPQRTTAIPSSANDKKENKNEVCLEVITQKPITNGTDGHIEKNDLKANIKTEISICENKVPLTAENSTEVVTSNGKYEAEKVSKPQKSYQNVEDIYKKERGNEKVRLNLVVVGHVDAGKSTLMGHVLFKLGQVSKRTMHKFEQDSKKLGKSSFMYAWVLDETPEERNRGITMDVAETKFETPSKCVVLLDAPGHKDFIPNMITGAAQADAAVLVVDSTKGEFETGFEAGGQTREHTMLIRSLGVSQLVVAVNKMDNVGWSQERFLEIKSKLTQFLRTVGYKESDAYFVPCSGLTGENLTTPPESPELKKWYKDSTIVDVIDGFAPPERPVNKPLRISINDVFKGITGGFCLAGRIDSGFIRIGDKVAVMPAGEQGSVKSIAMDDLPVQNAFAGESVIIQLNGIDINNVATGNVVCDIDRPIKVTSLFEARLVVFSIVIPITRGFPVILHYQSMSEQAIVKNIISQLNRSTGEVIKRKPRCLTKNTSAIVEIEVSKPICIELFKDFKGLGRFMLRHSGATIAAGLVTSLK